MGNPLLVSVDTQPITRIKKVFTLKLTEEQLSSIVGCMTGVDQDELEDFVQEADLKALFIDNETEWRQFKTDLKEILS
jgi:hypothetical protein